MHDLLVNLHEVQETTSPKDQENVALEVNQPTPVIEPRRFSRIVKPT